MIHRTKRFLLIGLASAALLASLATAASAAEFHAELSHGYVSGTQVGQDVETFNAGTWRCNQATFSGALTSATFSALKVTPAWSECSSFGFVNATRDVNGCQYVLGISGSFDIECPAGKSMVITVFSCHVTIPPQSGLGSITYTNSGSGKAREITADVSITGLKYTQESKSFPGCANGTFSNGTISGQWTFAGFHTVGNQIGLWTL